MNAAELLHGLTARLAAGGIESAAAEATLLLEAASGLNRLEQLTHEPPLPPAQLALLEQSVQRRLAREPLQLIIGSTNFYGLELKVAPGVLIPRPETEVLVELALARVRDISSPLIIDVGTGSGAIALAIKAERPDAEVVATDVSRAALELASENARALGLEVTVRFADLLDGAAAAEADLIISNPPYLPDADRDLLSPEVQVEPATALFAGADGLDIYRRLLRQALKKMKPGSWLLLELDPRNVAQAAALALGWAETEIEADLTGRKRFLLLRAA